MLPVKRESLFGARCASTNVGDARELAQMWTQLADETQSDQMLLRVLSELEFGAQHRSFPPPWSTERIPGADMNLLHATIEEFTPMNSMLSEGYS